MRTRVIATDLDGTLLRSDSSLSDRTRRALTEAQLAGIEVVVVTGRPPRAIDLALKEALGGRGSIICANGALVLDLAAGQVVGHRTIAPEVVSAVVATLRSGMPELAFGVEGIDRFGHEPGYTPLLRSPEMVVATIDELIREPVAKVLALHPERSPDQLVAEIRDLVAGTVEVTHSSSRGLAEISAVGVSKALALEERASELGFAANETIAFGDMPNDAPMLAWSGWSVGVANAHPEVLEVVDEVTATNDDDGVAVVIERLLEKG